jgi:lipopolysaccharide export LptBFGC system permease protein LptF
MSLNLVFNEYPISTLNRNCKAMGLLQVFYVIFCNSGYEWNNNTMSQKEKKYISTFILCWLLLHKDIYL